MLKIVGQIPIQNLHNATLSRSLSTSIVLGHKKLVKIHNVDEFKVHNRMGTKQFKREQFNKYKPKYPDVPIHRYGVRDICIKHPAKPEYVKELIPELIVPDLEGCQLKPYVPYSTKDIYQDGITAQDLFNAIYGPKIVADFKEGKLDENGNPLEPNEFEQLSHEEAFIKTVQRVFKGDKPAMFAARSMILCGSHVNLWHHRHVTSPAAIDELLKHGEDVKLILTEQVVQLQKVSDEKYHMKIRDETHMFENNPFREDITEDEYKNANKRARKRGGSCDEAKKESK